MAIARARSPSAHDTEVARSPPPPSTNKDVRYVRREMVGRISDGIEIRADVAEASALLERAMSVYKNAALEFREMSLIRRTTERHLVSKMKEVRTIYDGMQLMENEEDKVAWSDFVENMEAYKREQKAMEKEEEIQKQLAERERMEEESRAIRAQHQWVEEDVSQNPDAMRRPQSNEGEGWYYLPPGADLELEDEPVGMKRKRPDYEPEYAEV
ncbi:hypothetical protein H0H81_003408 [Sphagnurus paluster]|uniref:Uncharacterized protein n=1 Tax=Sphagnurus paluster TaxID=117069 RepID=A0A9P7KMR2_9AGAR|nr:hypothetical protein H0H81_003408 [Sphagnurus paluster]